MHQQVMDMWVNPRTMQSGPSVERILDKGLVMFPKLASMDVAAAVEFYDQLQKTSVLFLLPLMLFDAVNLHMGFEGLCPLGLGLPWYAGIAGVMMEVIPRLLPTYDSQVTLLVMVVHAESNNRYDLLWRVMELLVPGFDPTLQISAPVYMGEGIFDLCLSYILYFCLQVKKGLLYDDRTKSIMFLQAVHDPAYIDVITTLQTHIDTFQSKDFVYLPPTLCLVGLAAQMNKNTKARVRDIVPHVRCVEWHPDDHPAMTPCIQGFHLPQVYQTDFS
jgi:hypothetical protein